MKKEDFKNMEIADLCRQLALFLHAGVRLNDGLYLLSEEEGNSAYKDFLQDAARRLEDGIPLYTVFEQYGCFPFHVTSLLAVGEQTGRMEETLTSLYHYYEAQEHRNRQLRSALTYPAILLLMMLVVIVVLLSKVLPVFENVYASLGGSLSGLAGGLLMLGNILNGAMPILCILLALLILGVLLFAVSSNLRNKVISFWQLHFGDKGISRKMNDAKFAQALSMAYSSGLPLEECVSLAGSLLKNCPGALKRCEECRKRLDTGAELAATLKETNLLPASACKLLALGMRAGTGDTTLEEIAVRLSDEANEALEAKISSVEPALVLITSVLVGVILLTVMLPLLNIMKAIG